MSQDRLVSNLVLYRTPEVDRIEPEFLQANKGSDFVVIGRNFEGLMHQGQAIKCMVDEV